MAKSAQEAIQNLAQRLNARDGLSDDQVKNRRQSYPKFPQPAPKTRKQIDFVQLFETTAARYSQRYQITPAIQTITQYYQGFKDFGSDLVSNQPDLAKGLYVFGPYGTGKSLIFQIMQEIGRELYLQHGYRGMWFTSVTAPWLVQEYMKSTEKGYQGTFDLISYYRGPLYIDDLGMERQAFGRDDIIGDLLFERHKNHIQNQADNKPYSGRTFISSNLSPKEFAQKYGSRLGDRLFEGYNIIEFNGKSYRE